MASYHQSYLGLLGMYSSIVEDNDMKGMIYDIHSHLIAGVRDNKFVVFLPFEQDDVGGGQFSGNMFQNLERICLFEMSLSFFGPTFS